MAKHLAFLSCFLLAAATAALAAASADVEETYTVESGTVSLDAGKQPWQFIGSYCFDTQGNGLMNWVVDIERKGGGLIPLPAGNSTPATGWQLSLYDDQDSSFPLAWANRNEWSCEELLVPRRNKMNIPIPYAMSAPRSEAFADHNSGHQWFVVVSACGVPFVESDGMNFNYTLQFSNSEKRKESMELGDVPAPTAIYAILLIFTVAAFAFSTVFRTKREGSQLLKSHAHRTVTLLVLVFLLANISMWAWSGGHQASALSAFLFFQAVHQVFIFMLLLWLVVSTVRDRSFVSRVLGDVYTVFAFFYFIFWWTMSYEEFFPGVVGGTVYSNGLTITASVFRVIMGTILTVLLVFAFGSDKGHGSNIFVWLTVSVLAIAYMWLPMIALWSAYGDMFSCNPRSLMVSTWTNVFFDGFASLILVALVDPQWSNLLHGSVNMVAPSLLDEVNPHNWGDQWESISASGYGRSYGGLPAEGTDGIIIDDEPGTEISDTAAGSGTAPQKSYGTL